MTSSNSPTEPAKVLLRLPRGLHEQVKELAETHGVSVNTLLATLIAGGIGFQLEPDKK